MTSSGQTIQLPFTKNVRAFNAIFERERMALFGQAYGLVFFATVLEPLFHIGLVLLWHSLLGIMPVYGTSKVLFVSSGMYPLFVFIQLSIAPIAVVKIERSIRRLPAYNILDVIAARTIILLSTYLMVGIVLFGVTYVFVTSQALPYDFADILLSLAGLSALGIGIGMCNAAIAWLFKPWEFVYPALARSLILFGGVLYVPDFLPVYIRKWLVWNPTLHGVELFRQGIYPAFPKLLYSSSYFYSWAFASLILGLVMLRMLRRKI